MAKLNQIIAVEKGVKSRVYGEVTELYKTAQKHALFAGFLKSFKANDDDGERLPDEKQLVQHRAGDMLRTVQRLDSEVFQIVARKDWTNCKAVADVVVGGSVILAQVPVTYLLFLEKQLSDLKSFIAALPVLDPTEDWEQDQNSGLWKSEPTQTHRTKKTQRAIVLYNATVEHPAQTQLITEDVISGYWTNIKMSGGIPRSVKDKLADRVEMLVQAVKAAREEANGIDVVEAPDVGAALFGFLLEDKS